MPFGIYTLLQVLRNHVKINILIDITRFRYVKKVTSKQGEIRIQSKLS